jgi:hypothetical protein
LLASKCKKPNKKNTRFVVQKKNIKHLVVAKEQTFKNTKFEKD